MVDNQSDFSTPIILSVHRGRFRMDDEVEPSGNEYKIARRQALDEAKGSCLFCNHNQAGHLQVHHINCNHHDNSIENLAAVCFICHSNHHLWLAGKSKTNQGKSGEQMGSYMIYMPSVEQGLLNRFLMSCFAAKEHKNPKIQDSAIYALEQIELLKKPIEDSFGTSSAQIFGGIMSDIPEIAYEFRNEILSGIKMVMTPDSFMYDNKAIYDIVQSWEKFMPDDTWERIYKSVFKVIDEPKLTDKN